MENNSIYPEGWDILSLESQTMRNMAQTSRYSDRDWAAKLAAMVALAFIVAGQAAASTLSDVRFGETAADQTRIVFDIEGAVDYALSGDERGQGRLIVDVASLAVDGQGATPQKGAGLVSAYRYAAQPGGEARFVFQFGQTAKIAKAFVLEPRGSVKHHRLVIDLKASNKAEFVASLPKRYRDIADVIQSTTVAQAPVTAQPAPAKPVKPAETEKKKPVKTAQAGEWPIIVIDPGHGGGDPGALGQGGTLEKDVTLAAALELSDMLKAKGKYRIVLTRADDSRLGLQHRARIARSAKPDLFISLHADAIGDPDLRGGSVYTLSAEGRERSAQEAREQEDYQVNDLKMSEVDPTLGGILLDVTHDRTLTNSSRFATTLVKELKGVIPLLNNAHRQKDLRVLLAPDVPAVLLELGFISNKKDEKNLKSEKWREKAMTAVAEAIDEYFEAMEQPQRAAAAEISQAG